MKKQSALVLAVVAGAALELVVAAATGEPEAWDSPAYWTVALPAAVLFCGGLGYFAPAGFTLYGPLLMASQLIVMVVGSGGGALLPVGLVLSGLLSLPSILSAWLGATLRRRVVSGRRAPSPTSPSGPETPSCPSRRAP